MSELEIQENMSAEEAFMDTESAYEEIPEAFQKLAQLLGHSVRISLNFCFQTKMWKTRMKCVWCI